MLVRPPGARKNLAGLPIEIVEGDLLDAASIARAMQGVQFVFHVAADYRLWARNPSDIVHTNVEGTRLVMEAARRANVERIVYTSSVATLKAQPGGASSDETHPLDAASAVGGYKLSKVLAERMVDKWSQSKNFRPSSSTRRPRSGRGTFGRRRPAGSLSRRQRAACRLMSIPGSISSMSMTSPPDMFWRWRRAVSASATSLAAQDVLLGNMLREIAHVTGRKPPKVRLPRTLIFPIAYGAEAIAHFTGREPFVTVDGPAARQRSHVLFLGQGGA